MSIESVMPSKYAIKAGLKINIQKTRILASGPISSWQIDGEKVETVGFHFLGLQKLQTVTTVMKLKEACCLGKRL